MNKDLLNKYLRKLGFELHGLDSMYKFRRDSLKISAYTKQKEILGEDIRIIFDIGANRGDTVVEYNNLFPNAKIYAFEPFPDSYNIMEGKVKDLDNVTTYQKAIADKQGKSIMYVNKSVDTNSLLPSKISGLRSDTLVETKRTIEVDVLTIDQFCLQNNIENIDILKLDIQGGELAALKGCKRMLAEKKVKLIYTEAYFVEQYVGHPLFHEIYNYIYQFDFRLQDIYDTIYGKGSIAWCDLIFLPKY